MFPKFTIPRMLTKGEQQRLLATVRAQGSRRDIALLTLALGTGLRLREIRGLNVGDVLEGEGTAWRIDLDPAITKGKRGGIAYLTGPVRRELGHFVRWKRRHGEPVEPRSPLLVSRQSRRLSLRRIQFVFRKWQAAAGFEAFYPFHALRHTAITNVYRATKDLYLTQRFARHSSESISIGIGETAPGTLIDWYDRMAALIAELRSLSTTLEEARLPQLSTSRLSRLFTDDDHLTSPRWSG